MKINQTKEGLILAVRVKPKSREFKITVEGDDIVVFCTEEPLKGKVNKELIKELSKLFHKEVEFISGFTSKQKMLLVKGIGKDELERLLLGN
jgi:uncharacterized protein (TIGR00251 family)